MKDIVLTTINAKWIHPSLALRLLKANLGALEDSCQIIEFALRQPLAEKLEPFLSGSPKILGISVSIWNHTATIEFLKECSPPKPIIILGGPEVSHLPEDAEIFKYADYVIRGEGEIAFKSLCEDILAGKQDNKKFINAQPVELNNIKTAYHLYTDEDVQKKLIYIESNRGCPFHCDFCLSAVKTVNSVREFPLEPFLAEMETLIKRGVKTFKFLDRSFNININRALQIIEFFLEKINQPSSLSSTSASSASLHSEGMLRPCVKSSVNPSIVVHFEMVPSLLTVQLNEALLRFPPGSLRLEIGFQTLNPQIASLIKLPGNIDLNALKYLRENSNAIIHADLIAGLPGENLESFGKGFDILWSILGGQNAAEQCSIEIQLGILKQLPGSPISRHNENYAMSYNSQPPYEIEETSVIKYDDMLRIKNFARFWEILVNRGLIKLDNKPVFWKFMALSDALFEKFGRNWGIDKEELKNTVNIIINNHNLL